MSNLDYPIITPENPILTVYVKGIDLTSVVSVGETALYIRRVGDLGEFAKYYPFETRASKSQFSFAFDSVLFSRLGGRYEGRLVYNGVTIETLQFVYKPDVPALVGRSDV